MTITAYSTNYAPVCNGGPISVAGVTTAATAYDWFAITGSGALAVALAGMSTSTLVARANKAFIQSIAQDARIALMPLVKEELFNARFTTSKALINSSINNILNTLDAIQVPGNSAIISSLTPTYTSALNTITTTMNLLKTFETKVWSVGTSIDLTSSAIATAYATTTALTSFTGLKTYLATMIEPTTLSGGTALPTITSVNGNAGNAATLDTRFTTALATLGELSTIENSKALVSMSAQNIFDLYCMQIQGYASSATTGKWASGSAPVGIVPGVDFEVHLTGAFQSGAASAGTAGAPSATVAFW